MRIIFLRCSGALAALLMVSAAQAATVTTYSDRISFDAAVSATTVEDFGPTSYFPISSGVLNEFTNEAGIVPGDIQPGVTFSTSLANGGLFAIDRGGSTANAFFTDGFLDGLLDLNMVLTVDFTAPVEAFGFDTNINMGTSFDIAIIFAAGGGYAQTFAVAQSGPLEFFGFESDLADIESVTIAGNGLGPFAFALDDFAFTAVVPIPAAVWLFGSALGLLGWMRRKKAS
jgi:hypothetical protein